MNGMPNKKENLIQEITTIRETIDKFLLYNEIENQSSIALNIFNTFQLNTLRKMKDISDYNMALLQVVEHEKKSLEKNKNELKKSQQTILKLLNEKRAFEKIMKQERNKNQNLKKELEQNIIALENNSKEMELRYSQEIAGKEELLKITETDYKRKIENCNIEMLGISKDCKELKVINEQLVREKLNLELQNKNLILNLRQTSSKLDALLEGDNRKRKQMGEAIADLIKNNDESNLGEQLQNLKKQINDVVLKQQLPAKSGNVNAQGVNNKKMRVE